MTRAFLRTFVVIALGACGADTGTTVRHDDATIRVLFIGNSLTYTNDLPSMVEAVAAAAGADLKSESVALGNYALIDHWNDGHVQGTIRQGGYDFVVLQQGPSSLAVNRDSLRLTTALFDPVIRESGAQTALFAVWPEAELSFAFADVAESYRLAAQDVGGIYLPVGNAWLRTWDEMPDAPLYGSDGYHPGLAGTYAAAAVMVAVFTGRDARTLPLHVPGVDLSEQLISTINKAAFTAIHSSDLVAR